MANLKINKDYIILCLIWLIGLVIDRTWFFLDNSIPAYDQSAHLTTALHHYRIFQNLNLLLSDWWSSLWELTPSYRAPFVPGIWTLIGQLTISKFEVFP